MKIEDRRRNNCNHAGGFEHNTSWSKLALISHWKWREDKDKEKKGETLGWKMTIVSLTALISIYTNHIKETLQ